MRDYGKVAPTFWTGDTGRFLRSKGPRVQLIALYLLTCQSSHMSGLFYLALPTLCHETGSPLEGALEALASLSEGGFAFYDEATETVFLPEMARYQIGETLEEKDNRHKGLLKYLDNYRKSPFYNDFLERYASPFHLPLKPLVSPLQAPPKGRVRTRAEQEKEQEKEQEQDSFAASPQQGQTEPQKEEKKPRPRDLLFDAIAEVGGGDPIVNGDQIGKVAAALRKARPPYTPEEVRKVPEAVAAAGLNFTITVGSIEKYIAYTRTPPSRASPPANSPPQTKGQQAVAKIHESLGKKELPF